MNKGFTISGKIVDIAGRKVFPGTIHVEGQSITKIEASDKQVADRFILPGFIDSHVHVESSMLTPSGFARMAVPHGTVATISDPHEIANVMGIEGVEYMLEDGKKVPFKFYFGAPSCVPATSFETAGAEIDVDGVEVLLKKPEIKYLAEMMNFPGVLYDDEVVHQKIALAKKYGKPIDGHAPGLRGEQAKKYIDTGISTDHECFTAPEALDKLKYGMKILIREGSAAKNFEALIELLPEYWQQIMFCSDDKHPDSLLEGHINLLVKRALQKGNDLFHILTAACINPVKHYNLEVGLLQEGDYADFIVVDDLENFNVQQTYINGELVAEQGKSNIPYIQSKVINQFDTNPKTAEDFAVKAGDGKLQVIEALDGQLITNKVEFSPKVVNGLVTSDVDNDVLKITVVNRYQNAAPAIAFIKNFGLKTGAIASSVGHDSHNIIAAGVDDESICKAVNLLIKHKGGISAVNNHSEEVLPLPVAGIMTNKDGYEVAQEYINIDRMAKDMGSKLGSPYMTLSFMALLVIPSLKLSDLGLFDGEKFVFTPLMVS